MVRPDQPAGTLDPRRDLPPRFQVPAKNDRRNADSGKGSAVVGQQDRPGLAFEFVFGLLQMRRGRKGLPVRHQFACILELSSQEAGQMLVGDDPAETHASAGKAEVRAIANTDASLEEWAEFPGPRGKRC